MLDEIAAAHAAARERVHAAGGGPGGDGLVPLDIDPTIVVAHSEKELAAPTFKRTFGHHRVLRSWTTATAVTGEALAGLLRRGSANADTAADLVSTLDAALAALPAPLRSRVLIRSDGGGYSHAFFDAVTARGLEFSIGLPQRRHPAARRRGGRAERTAVRGCHWLDPPAQPIDRHPLGER